MNQDQVKEWSRQETKNDITASPSAVRGARPPDRSPPPPAVQAAACGQAARSVKACCSVSRARAAGIAGGGAARLPAGTPLPGSGASRGSGGTAGTRTRVGT